MRERKPTCDELAERIRQLEMQHKSDLELIENLKRASVENNRSLAAHKLLSRFGRDIILFIRRHDARILDFNDAALKAYGYSREELLSLSVFDLRAPQTLPLSTLQFQQADMAGILFETIHRRKDGTLFPVEVSSIGAEHDGERLVISIIRDVTERKRTEDALRESQAKLVAALSSMNDALFISDAEGKIVQLNDAFAAFHRFPNREESVRALAEDPDFLDVCLAVGTPVPMHRLPIPSALRGETASNAEYILRRKDTGETWVGSYSYGPIHGKSGAIVGAVIVGRDITENKRAVESLRKSENLLRAVIENSADAIYVKDTQSRWLMANPAVLRIVGKTEDEALGKSDLDLYGDPDIGLVILENDRRILRHGKPEMLEEVVDTPEGRRTFLSIKSPWRDAKGEIIGLVGISHDITARKTAEEELKRSQRHLAEAQRQSHIGSFDFDFQTGRLDWSEEMFHICGLARESFQGKEQDFINLIHPDDLPNVSKRRQEGLACAGPLDVDFRIIRPDGEIRYIRLIFETMFQGNMPLRRMGTFQDITEIKKAEEERIRLAAQLQQAQKMESVGRLAGGIAHDFNNMLGVILGHVDLALEQIGPEEPVHEDLQEIRKTARRSADLTRQLLAFARKQTISPQILDLNENIAGTLKMLQRTIGENIRIQWQPEANLWPIKADSSQIDQILANLCINARDAIMDVGEIAIEAGNCLVDSEHASTLEDLAPGEYVRIIVRDNGCGMEQEVLDHVFEPFFTTKQIGKGIGLGLAMVYGAVKQNNGFIYVDSKPGVGTTFSIYFPRQVTPPQKPAAKISPARQGRETVLLVEDEPGILNLVTRLLLKQGYEVLATGNPAEALRLAREHPGEIHLLITDVVMPEMNGRILAENLRTGYPNIKCLFMSGYTADIVASQGILDEGVSFIQKPFSAKDLADKLTAILG